MRDPLSISSGSSKVLAALTVGLGLMFLGCSGKPERSEAAKTQFKQVAESESKLLKQKGAKGLRKGIGAPKSIKGKLGNLEGETGE